VKPKKVDKRKLVRKLDKLFSEIIRSQGMCDKCGKRESLQCSHVLSRRHLQTRWDLENALCLCTRCHLYWQHKEPHEFVRWFDEKFGGNLYDELKKRANRISKIDYETKYNDLLAISKLL
jgi:hypothetical protein